MASNDIVKFNFPDLRRYRWRKEDFERLQNSVMDTSRGSIEGSFGAAILEGFDVEPDTNDLHVDVNPGIAAGATGYLHVHEGVSGFDFDAPVSNPVRHLLVSRPLIVPADYITKPTAPNTIVPLVNEQLSEIVAVLGTPAVTPEYPATEAGDVVIAGVRIEPGQTGISEDDLDFEVRDVIGKNSRIQQNQAKYDDRLRCFRSAAQEVTVKPSQTKVGRDAKAFTYVLAGVPSKFPKDALNAFVFGDTFLNFQTGAITGADETSANFTPTIPSAGEAVVAAISLLADDTLAVSYGTPGTRAECFDGIRNSRTAGAGSVSFLPGAYRLAFVVVYSHNGTAVTELDCIDARSPFALGGGSAQKDYPNVFLSPAGQGDVTTLQEAVDALPATGGVILLMDDITVPAPVTLKPGTKLLGRGKGVTMTFSGASGILTDDNCIIEEVLFEDGSAGGCAQVICLGDYGVIRKCNFTALSGDADSSCVLVQGDGNHIGECLFEGVLSPSLAGAIVYLPGSSENTDENCVFAS